MRVLFVVAEAVPFVKTGGLADVAGALPAALRARGIDVRLLIPAYPAVAGALTAPRRLGQIEALAELPPAAVLAGEHSGATVLAVDCPPLFAREGGPFQDREGRDWPDNALRFGQLCRAAAHLAVSGGSDGWRPDVLHLNDWHAGLAAAYVRHGPRPRTPVVMTIHNLAFGGLFEPHWLARLGLPDSCWSIEGVEFYGKLSFMKAGLVYANAITTVSPSYAREIQQAPLGMGFEGLLAARRDLLTGILHGIDTAAWDPRHDPLIAAAFDADTLAGKAENKRALQRRFGLAERADLPLAAMVSRLTEQKGVDLVLEAAEALIAAPAQLIVVGTGQRRFEDALQALAQRHFDRVGVHIGFDEALAHQVEAGADLFLMPSRFEPCGLNQMYSQRYGTVPIVGATGGLLDSVVDCTDATLAEGTASGFHVRPIDAHGLRTAWERALEVWRDPQRWRRLQRAGMQRDFGWDRPAGQYQRIYAEVARKE